MDRGISLDALRTCPRWDVLVIGGGATGLGAAVDAAARGYRTILLEQDDFAKGTSSRSTKLVHGGVRYLRQGNVSLVRESLQERALLLRNAPEITKAQAFIVPAYSAIDLAFYGAGLKLYDALAGKLSLGRSQVISRAETLERLPTLKSPGLRGGVLYWDGQFDDARLAIALAETLHHLGGFPLNYVRVIQMIRENGRVHGVIARDLESGLEMEVRAQAVVNATGVFSDEVRRMDKPNARSLVTPSQGAHIVVEKSFLGGDTALMVPKTRDGRVLFAIPWHNRLVIGTTDQRVEKPQLDPFAMEQEIEFLLEHAAAYLATPVSERDIVSTFAGQRPLVQAGGKGSTSKISRDHVVFVSPSGLVTITGGKWTTYRRMGEDVITRAAEVAGLPREESRTAELRLIAKTADFAADSPELDEKAVSGFIREEMARTVEDVLARRIRLAITDPEKALACAPKVAGVLARELKRDGTWEETQVNAFRRLIDRTRIRPRGAAAGA